MNIEARMAEYGAGARQLSAAIEPVFIFDGRQPILVWANDAALSFVGFGHRADGPKQALQLPHLDRSMPAIMQLRALAGEDIPASGVRLSLVFWTAQGAKTLAAQCRRANFAFAPDALIVHGVDDGTYEHVVGRRPDDEDGATKQSMKTVAAPEKATTSRKSKPARARTKENADRKRRATAKREASQLPLPAILRAATPSADAPVPANVSLAVPSPYVEHATLKANSQPAPRPDASGDSVALREIARQIQSATSAHFAALRPAGRIDDPPTVSIESQPDQKRGPEADFLCQMGHEIRTPLNSILGFAEIMREERLGPVGNVRYKAYAADIHDSATHALSLINDLLDLSRLEAGGLQLDPVEVDVAVQISRAVASMKPIAEKAGVALSAPAGRPMPKLVCDARAFKQMLLNLLSNAIKHTDSGGAVWVTAASSDDGGLVVRIQDTGVGMSEEDLAIALEPYKQVGAAERRAGGTGLGLPLTKAMAQANHGRLVLERVAGGGLAALLNFGPDRVVRG